MNEQNTIKPDLERIESFIKFDIRKRTNEMVKRGPTPAHGNKSRGVGITRKSGEETKKKKLEAKHQRRVNHARKNKKFRPTGSKQRK